MPRRYRVTKGTDALNAKLLLDFLDLGVSERVLEHNLGSSLAAIVDSFLPTQTYRYDFDVCLAQDEEDDRPVLNLLLPLSEICATNIAPITEALQPYAPTAMTDLLDRFSRASRFIPLWTPSDCYHYIESAYWGGSWEDKLEEVRWEVARETNRPEDEVGDAEVLAAAEQNLLTPEDVAEKLPAVYLKTGSSSLRRLRGLAKKHDLPVLGALVETVASLEKATKQVAANAFFDIDDCSETGFPVAFGLHDGQPDIVFEMFDEQSEYTAQIGYAYLYGTRLPYDAPTIAATLQAIDANVRAVNRFVKLIDNFQSLTEVTPSPAQA